MQELFFTILIIWVLFKIFGGRSVFTFNTHYHQSRPGQKPEGQTRIEQQPKNPRAGNGGQVGEYVDFEEIKD